MLSARDLYSQEISVPLLTPEEEVILIRRAQEGDKNAVNELVLKNQRMVCAIARRYMHTLQGLEFLDLVQMGNIGLLKAIQKFDQDRGIRFTTYAWWWVRQYIQRESAIATRISVSHGEADKMRRVRRSSARLNQKNAREATETEISEDTGLRKEEIAQIAILLQSCLSLDGGYDEDRSELDRLSAPEEEASAYCEYDLKRLEVALSTLDARTLHVIRARYGLDGGEPLAYRKIGSDIGITGEMVRLIVDKGISKLKSVLSYADPRGLFS